MEHINLSDEQIQQIEIMAQALLLPSDIATLLDIPKDNVQLFIAMCANHKDSAIYKAYHKGTLTTKFKLQQLTVKFALSGSPTAQPVVERLLKDVRSNS